MTDEQKKDVLLALYTNFDRGSFWLEHDDATEFLLSMVGEKGDEVKDNFIKVLDELFIVPSKVKTTFNARVWESRDEHKECVGMRVFAGGFVGYGALLAAILIFEWSHFVKSFARKPNDFVVYVETLWFAPDMIGLHATFYDSVTEDIISVVNKDYEIGHIDNGGDWNFDDVVFDLKKPRTILTDEKNLR